MNTLLINKRDGDYIVSVNWGSITKDYTFTNHADLTAFVNRLKKDGYLVINDVY
jgi:hypothetical protein